MKIYLFLSFLSIFFASTNSFSDTNSLLSNMRIIIMSDQPGSFYLNSSQNIDFKTNNEGVITIVSDKADKECRIYTSVKDDIVTILADEKILIENDFMRLVVNHESIKEIECSNAVENGHKGIYNLGEIGQVLKQNNLELEYKD